MTATDVQVDVPSLSAIFSEPLLVNTVKFLSTLSEPFTAAVTDKAASLRIAATAVVARLAILPYALNKERWYNSDRRAKWHHLWVLLSF